MPRQERERRYISEYMKETYPEGNYQLNVPVGPIPQDMVDVYGQKAAAALFRPTRLRVDAVHWSPERYDLIEAKLRAMKDGIGDLLIYGRVAPQTQDLPYYEGQPFHLVLVIPFAYDWILDITRANDIQVDVFYKEWISEYARERQNYQTAEYRKQRKDLMDLRGVLGVD